MPLLYNNTRNQNLPRINPKPNFQSSSQNQNPQISCSTLFVRKHLYRLLACLPSKPPYFSQSDHKFSPHHQNIVLFSMFFANNPPFVHHSNHHNKTNPSFKQQLLINQSTAPHYSRIKIYHIHTSAYCANIHCVNIHHVAQIVAYCTLHDTITQHPYALIYTHTRTYALCTHIAQLFYSKTHKSNPPDISTLKPIP